MTTPTGEPRPERVDGSAAEVVRWDRGLSALVGLSAAMAGGERAAVESALVTAAADADLLEVEEAILQSYLFLGFPVALNAFAEWRRVSGMDAPASASSEGGPESDVQGWRERGERTCARVYGRAYPALRENIGRLKPELDAWMILEGYGKVLSRPGLSLGRRECCIAAILAVRDLPVQLRSHMRGALRCGATPETLERILRLVEPLTTDAALQRARAVTHAVVSGSEE